MGRAMIAGLAIITTIAVYVAPVATQSSPTAEVQGPDGQDAGPPPASVLGAQPLNTQARPRSGKRTALGIALVAAGTAWLAVPSFTEATPAQETLQALRDVGLLNERISWFHLDNALRDRSPLPHTVGDDPPVCWESGSAVFDACLDSGVRGAVAATLKYDRMAAGRRLALGGWQRGAATELIGAGVLMSTLWADVPVAITPTAGGAQVGVQRAVGLPDRGGRGLSVRAYGGWRQLRGGDINDTVAAFAHILSTSASTLPGGGGDVAATRRGSEVGADVIVHVTLRIGLVGGIGWIASASEGALETPLRHEPSGFLQSTALRVRAIPVRFGVQYTYPVGRRVGVTLEGGAGVYFSRLQYSHRVDATGRITDWHTDGSGYDLGGHGGVWVDVSVANRIGLVVGVHGTHANIGGLVGFRAGRFSDGFESIHEGTLRLVEDSVGVPFLIVGTTDQFGSLTPVRDARIGLGGLRITSGLRIAF